MRGLAPFAAGPARRALLLCALLGGCQSTIESGLTESDANRALVALDQHGIHGTKETDPGAGEEATYSVLVGPDEVAAALAVLRAEDLPSRTEPGIQEVFGAGSLVPTATEERARLAAALGGELARSVESIEGVLDARVHVALPDTAVLPLDAPPPRPRASVLVRYRGEPPDERAVQRLVAGAVQGMDEGDVAVVQVRAPEAAVARTHVTRVLGISVASGSAFRLRALLGGLLGALSLLTVLLVVVFVRARRAREATPAPEAPKG